MLPLKKNLQEKILKLQLNNEWYKEVKVELENEVMKVPKYEGYTLEDDKLLRFNKRIYVPPNDEICNLILFESHRAIYMFHPGAKKMFVELKPLFFWNGMKSDVVNYVEKFLECQLVKVEHRHPTGLLQPHAIPESKWEIISMDFIVGLLITPQRHDYVFVVVDTLTKSAHFIPIKTTYQAHDIAKVFINEIVRLHGISNED